GRFADLVGARSDYLASLPTSVRQRLNALRNLNKETRKIDRAFQREINELEKKYYSLHAPVFAKRRDIIVGTHEPTEAECERNDQDEDDELPEAPSDGSDIKGIPEFWLTCLKNLPPLTDTITDEDDDALKHLTDIRYSYLDGNPGFVLEFHFEENDYFTNKVLSKTYYLIDSDEAQDLVYDHAEGYASLSDRSTEIDWKEGKDLSVRIEVKKQRHKATNKTRTVKKTVPAETFFNFFKAIPIPEDEEEVDEDLVGLWR
ncbi:hypothetical protein HDU91_002676, partial [Kappamyces sp. JEL0680]